MQNISYEHIKERQKPLLVLAEEAVNLSIQPSNDQPQNTMGETTFEQSRT